MRYLLVGEHGAQTPVGSAKKSGFEQGWKVSAIKVPTDRPSKHWIHIPALALLAFVWFLQRARSGAAAA